MEESQTIPLEDAIKHQEHLEDMFSKHKLMPTVRNEFINETSVNFKEKFIQANLPEKFGFDLLAQLALHKQADLVTLVGMLRHHFDGDCQQTADALLAAAENDLVDCTMKFVHSQTGTKQPKFITKYLLSEDVMQKLDFFQYPLPMVVAPKPITNNKENGMLTQGGSVILKNKHHNYDVCLDHLNRMNKVPLIINMETALMVKNRWADLDSPKSGEDREKFKKRVRAFEKYNRTTLDVIDYIMKVTDHLYMTYRYDVRGRTYAAGYHVNPQGNEWNKSIIELANAEVVSLE